MKSYSKSLSASRSVSVRRCSGHGLVVATSRGDVKAYPDDHIVEIPYTRRARQGELGFDPKKKPDEQVTVNRTQTFVVPVDFAKGVGIAVSDEEHFRELENARRFDSGRQSLEEEEEAQKALSISAEASKEPSKV